MASANLYGLVAARRAVLEAGYVLVRDVALLEEIFSSHREFLPVNPRTTREDVEQTLARVEAVAATV